MNNLNKENDILNENRHLNNKRIKIKRLKIGMIIAIISGTTFIALQGLIEVNYNWYFAARQRVYIDYNQELISYDEYRDRRDQLELEFYVNLWSISIFSTVAKVGMNIVFIFIIIFLLSIVLDESFNRKMRRLSLGLAGILLLFILYPIIISTFQFPLYPLYYIP